MIFYHITPQRNVLSIVSNGLKWGKQNGICVLVTNHELIIEYVTEMMLLGNGDVRFAVFKIDQDIQRLSNSDIVPDTSEEFTNSLHRYIKKDKLILKESDYIQSYIVRPYGIPNLEKLQKDIREAGLLDNSVI